MCLRYGHYVLLFLCGRLPFRVVALQGAKATGGVPAPGLCRPDLDVTEADLHERIQRHAVIIKAERGVIGSIVQPLAWLDTALTAGKE